MDDAEIKRLRELCEKATPGPWEATGSGDIRHINGLFYWGISEPNNADFIAAARTALPRLLDELAARQKRIAELEFALNLADGALSMAQDNSKELEELTINYAASQERERNWKEIILALCDDQMDIKDARAALAESQP